jgi:hypothetical protein
MALRAIRHLTAMGMMIELVPEKRTPRSLVASLRTGV